jgi:hypothetical protein
VRHKKRSGPSPVVVVATVAAVAAAVAALLARLGRRFPSRGRGARDASDRPGQEPRWTCQCGQEFRVSGEGRHRVYWLIDADPADPVITGRCPNCDRPLPDQQVVEAA